MLPNHLFSIWEISKRIIVLILLAIGPIGCKKLIEVDPPVNSIIGNEIYNSDATASSVLTGIYTDMSNAGVFVGQIQYHFVQDYQLMN